MKKVFVIALMMVALSVTVNAQNDASKQRRATFKERSEVLADSIRAKAPRLGKSIAEKGEIFADSVGAKAPRLGKSIAEKGVVFADSVGAKGVRFGEKARIAGDTMAVRSRKAIKVMKGE